MNSQTSPFHTGSIEKLMTQIGFAGAQYGLHMPVLCLATYLGKKDQTRPASVLMLGVLNISLKNYEGARTIFTTFLQTKGYEPFYPEAKGLLEALDKVAPAKVKA